MRLNYARISSWILFFAVIVCVVVGASNLQSVKLQQPPVAASRPLQVAHPSASTRVVEYQHIQQIAPAPKQQEAQRRLVDDFDDLKAKADADDSKAASQLYRKVLTCNRSARTQWNDMNNYAQLKAATATSTEPDDLERAESETRQYVDRINDTAQLCDGATDNILQSLPEITLQAANLGDSDARACYIHRGPLVDAVAAINHPELFADYRSNAEKLIDEGLNSGDWKVVDMLMYAYSARGNQILSGITGFDPLTAYRYKKLWDLGLHDDSQLAAHQLSLVSARAGLSDREVTLADEWAKTEFENNFGSAGDSAAAVPPVWDACMIPKPAPVEQ